MRQMDWTVLALAGLPVLAAISLGLLAREFLNGRRRSAVIVWALVSLLVCGLLWAYVFARTP